MNTHISDFVAVLIIRMDPLMCSKYLPSHKSQAFGVLLVGKLSSFSPLSKISPVTGLEWPRGFPEIKVPRFHDNGTGSW